jgi:hypothetical protein
MNAIALIAFLLGLAVMAAVWAVDAFWRGQAKPTPPRKSERDRALSAAERRIDPDQWIAMPGRRIELGATGFYISLHTAGEAERLAEPYLYRLWAPEGRLIAHSMDLQSLKTFGRRLAAERDEFVPRDLEPLPSSITTKATRP